MYFIWLLDDDNLPSETALDILVKKWHALNPGSNQKLFSLLSYRTDRETYKKAVIYQKPELMLGPKNSFLGFHFSYKLLNKKRITKQDLRKPDAKWGPVSVAPYGGMFFSRTLLDEIGLPDEKLFLYADDMDFSYRIIKKGGHIFLILESVINDLETSFHIKQNNIIGKSRLNTRYFNTDNKDAIYYSVRNNIIFEQNFVKNRVIYNVNKYLYLGLLIVLFTLRINQFWKFPLILKAIRHSKVKGKEYEN